MSSAKFCLRHVLYVIFWQFYGFSTKCSHFHEQKCYRIYIFLCRIRELHDTVDFELPTCYFVLEFTERNWHKVLFYSFFNSSCQCIYFFWLVRICCIMRSAEMCLSMSLHVIFWQFSGFFTACTCIHERKCYQISTFLCRTGEYHWTMWYGWLWDTNQLPFNWTSQN